MSREALLRDLRAQDALLRRHGLDLWTGGEPTFTDPSSHAPEWLTAAEVEGGEKPARGRALARALAARLPGPVRLAAIEGRRFPGEERPRFCLAVSASRSAPAGGPRGPASPGGDRLDAPPVEAPPPGPDEARFTVTPDPGVVEVNLAPTPSGETFLGWCEAAWGAAEEAGLSPIRFRFDGEEGDSGGGGQLTFGGPTPEASPFFRHPALLPRLVRYLVNHPSLSYAFAGECKGSASQGPRPDEGARERFEELPVALARLEAAPDDVDPKALWEALAPLLVDAAGNSHRAELNVEKLWNPHLEGRGRLGLVELRALRMQPTPARAAAVAALFRAVLARLALHPFVEPFLDHGPALHDRFALPFHVAQDLAAVLADLDRHGLHPGPEVEALAAAAPAPVATLALPGATLTLTPASEFWPLVGDVASQERSPARLVDASARRLQVLVSHGRGGDPGRVAAAGWEVPLRAVDGGAAHLGAVRWRAFVPPPGLGLHPTLPALDPLPVTWARGGSSAGVALHGWRPEGGAYEGLPRDAEAASRRRAERVRPFAPGPLAARTAAAQGGLTLDLRRVLAATAAGRAASGASP